MSEKAIAEAEEKWLHPLSQHCRKIFENTFLPSHDHLHHTRVWSNARSLLLLMEAHGTKIPQSLPLELMISTFFHDTGLTRTRGEKHGLESRKLCEEFFHDAGRSGSTGSIIKSSNESGQNNVDSIYPGDESMEKILHAIEHHDDKSLKTKAPVFSSSSIPDLLSLLSTSDDLDAFGNMGIYRFAEIYLLRGIASDQLPARVIENVRDRFENIRRSFGKMEDFIRFHESRYLRVRDFYLGMGEANASLDEKPSWEPVLIEIFKDSLDNKINLLASDRLLPDTEFDREIRAWFKSLDEEK